jgi:sugar phosphate isomerase/epimerase
VLARVCARHGVRLGIEFEPGHLVGSAAQMCDLLAALDSPLVGVNLDIGHVVCAGEDPAEAVRALRGRIWNVHLEDIRGRIHEHLIPGEGDVDFRAVFSALEETGYDGFVTLELYPYADDPGGAGRRALEHLRARLG